MQVYFDERQVLPSYSGILYTYVEGSGKEANHMRNILKIAIIIARGKETFGILVLDTGDLDFDIHLVLL